MLMSKENMKSLSNFSKVLMARGRGGGKRETQREKGKDREGKSSKTQD